MNAVILAAVRAHWARRRPTAWPLPCAAHGRCPSTQTIASPLSGRGRSFRQAWFGARAATRDRDRSMDSPLARVIAFYLPQYYPIPENDEWWGRGFTEWTNTAKAKPLFRGHYQPHVPADLGFYDLRLPETRAAQAQLAREHGVEGFCYYHYWFAGRRILERPFDEVLASGQPDLPFCLNWANQTWSGIWHGAPQRVLIEQTYPGMDDHRRHFDALLPAFTDRALPEGGWQTPVRHLPSAGSPGIQACARSMARARGEGRPCGAVHRGRAVRT